MDKTAWWDKPLAWYGENIKPIIDPIISGMWVVRIVNQMIITAGNIAESAFLLATLWVLINIAGQTLITWIIDAHTIVLINNLCSIAFAALPELLFFGVVKTCIGHFLTAFKQRDKVALAWAILYSIPAISFGIITVYVLSIASRYGLQTAINLGEQWLIVRYLSGLFYAIIHSIDQTFAKPHFASKMTGKDQEISDLKARIESLTSDYQTQIETIKVEYQSQITQLSSQLNDSVQQVNRLAERASSLDRDALACYPKVYFDWIEKGVKTVSIDQIEEVTGLSKQRISGAIRSGKLVKDPRSKDGAIRVSSVIDWLKTMPVIESSNGRDTDPLQLSMIS